MNLINFSKDKLPQLTPNTFYEVDGIMKIHQTIEVHAIRPSPSVNLMTRYRAIKLAKQFPEFF